MLQTIKNAWKEPDIRKKVFYTLFILLLYRIGTIIPVPFVDASAFTSQYQGTILDYLNTLSGGSLQMATLFALGISPYITASIVIQLLTVAIPILERWSKEGEEGKKKINNLTRYVTVLLAIGTAIGYYFLLGGSISTSNKVLGAFVVIISYCAGAAMVMWLAEKINEKGLGNGISVILFANIISALPAKIIRLVRLAIFGFSGGNWGLWGTVATAFGVFYIALLIAMVVFSVFVTGSERRLNVQYAKRVVGRKMYGGQSQSLPLKLNMSGVMPVIFASSIISLPATIMAFCGVKTTEVYLPLTVKGSFSWSNLWSNINHFLAADGWFYPIVLFILIIAFSYFYIMISFNPVEVANNLKKNGGSIPGIRPGRPTVEHITRVLNRITLIGAIFLGFIAVFPMIINMVAGGQFAGLAFGGSSLLIVVGVALETTRDLEAQMSLRHYKGFLE